MTRQRERSEQEHIRARKVFCEIIQGVVYEDRCLFKLSKVIEGNRSCMECILQEIEKLKRRNQKRERQKDQKERKEK